MLESRPCSLLGLVVCLCTVSVRAGDASALPVAAGILVPLDDEDGPPKVDPYTENDPGTIAALGYRKLGGPFLLTQTHNTEAVEQVLGRRWMLWVETEHFKIGSTLAARYAPKGDRELVERWNGQLERLRARGLKLPKKVKELDEWLLLHFYALRLEELYTEFEQRFGVTDASFPPAPPPGREGEIDRTTLGPYLGAHGKFLVMLFDEKADLARYLGRFTGKSSTTAMRSTFFEEDVHLFATAREIYSISPSEHSHFECHVLGNTLRMLVCAYRGFRYNLPEWWVEGLAHWYTRRIDETFFSPTVSEGQDADYRKDHDWETKVFARVDKDYWPPSRELLCKSDPGTFSFADHLMAWSRVDFLMSRPDGRPGAYLDRMKSVPWHQGLTAEEICAVQPEALREGFELDYDSLDTEWVEWVRKEYRPGRKRDR